MTHRIIPELKEHLLNLIFPRVCPLCGQILTSAAENREADGKNPYICRDCYQQLHFPAGPRCMKCSRPLLDENQEYCDDCAAFQKPFDQGTALLLHDAGAKKILYDLKYSNKRDNADMLAFEAADRCGRRIRQWRPDVLVPVPLHKKRQLQRGFNQSEVLAKRLSGFLKEQGMDIPVESRLLVRNKATSPQKELNRKQRILNIQGAFQIGSGFRQGRIPYRRILLIDDIYTSGTTLSACAAVLKRAGAEEVYFLTFSIG